MIIASSNVKIPCYDLTDFDFRTWTYSEPGFNVPIVELSITIMFWYMSISSKVKGYAIKLPLTKSYSNLYTIAFYKPRFDISDWFNWIIPE